MSTRRTHHEPATSSAPTAAEALVPPQAGGQEPGPPAERLAYSVDEAARLTGLSRDLLYDEMRRGHLDYLKVGRRRLITRQHLEQFLNIIPSLQPSEAANRTSELRTANDAR
jgi:excisionase family DNA binding protein